MAYLKNVSTLTTLILFLFACGIPVAKTQIHKGAVDQIPKAVDPGVGGIELLEVRAGAETSVTLHREAGDILSDDPEFNKDLSGGAVIDYAAGILSWRADIQDIGTEKDIQLGFLRNGKKAQVKLHVKVLPPSVVGHACASEPSIFDATHEPQEEWIGDIKGTDKELKSYSPIILTKLGEELGLVTVQIVSTTDSANGYAVIRNAESGEIQWTSQDLNTPLVTTSGVMLNDLDGDKIVELIAVTKSDSEFKLVAFKVDGKSLKFLGTTPLTCADLCLPIAINTSGTGKTSIIAGEQIFDLELKMVAELKPKPKFTTNRTTLVADLVESSPGDEIIVGSQVYTAAGEHLWTGHDDDDFVIIADLDQKEGLELIAVGNANLRVYDNTGKAMWTRAFPVDSQQTVRTNAGGPPIVAPFQVDGKLGVAVASAYHVLVYDSAGTEIARIAIEGDGAGSSPRIAAHDFDGDSISEILISEFKATRIISVKEQKTLWSVPVETLPDQAFPRVANIDSDSGPEILIPTKAASHIVAIGDPFNRWFTNDITKKGNKILLPDMQAIPPLYWDREPKVPGKPSLTFYVANAGEASLQGITSLTLFDATGTLIGTGYVDSILDRGQGVQAEVVLNQELHPEKQKNLVLRINLDKDEKLTEKDCEIKNNIIKFSLEQ